MDLVATALSSINRNSLTRYELWTGGRAVPGRWGFFLLGAQVQQIGDFFYPEADGQTTRLYYVPSNSIFRGDFGRQNSGGWAIKACGNGEVRDVTPTVSSLPYYQYWFVAKQQYLFNSQGVATVPADQTRTTIGVGEQVNLGFNPGLPVNAVWSNTAGTLTGTLTNANTLTAPERATNLTVNATILGETCSIDFNVLEPTGIDSASFLEYWNYSSQTYAGAGVHFRPFIGPTNVSFYAVQIKEVGEDATNVTGYFLFHAPPSHIGNGADAWISLDYDNHWLGDYDWAKSSGWPPPWSGAGPPGFSGGSYTWNIPAKWRVNGGSEHEMKGWNQVHTLLGNGTMTVSKFGHSVSLTIQNQYSGQ